MPEKKLAIFNSENIAKYTIQVANDYKETQSGTVSYRLLTEKGEEVNTAITDVTVKGNGKKKVKFEVPAPNPGFYDLIVEKTWLNLFLTSKIMQQLCKIHYEFYSIHIGFIAHIVCKWTNIAMDSLTDWLDDVNFSWLSKSLSHLGINFFILFLVLNTTAFLTWRYTEEALTKWVKKSH